MNRAIGAPLTGMETAELIRACRLQVNVKFRHRGRSPATGFDCIGLVAFGLTSIGRPLSDKKSYGREPHKDGLRQGLIDNLGQPVQRDSMRAGDVVLMTFDQEPRHVGLLFDHPAGGLAIVHTHSRVKKVTEHRLDDQWRSWVVEVFRP